LPARFRRQRVLIVGCGDVGLRVADLLRDRVRLLGLTSSADRRPLLRAHGVLPLAGNLDDSASLRRLSGLATRLLHLAPPPAQGGRDTRTQALVQALRRRSLPRSLVYGSTSGVYGDCQGQWVRESRPVQPATPRALRRVDAEYQVRRFGAGAPVATRLLRIPGIYAADRVGGTPLERLRKGTPVLRREDDVFTNHIHADDLARACLLALWRGRTQRGYNVCDDTQLRMGDYFDLAADLWGLPRPPRVSRQTAATQLPPLLLSFMSESRRLDNSRMKRELRMALRYPQVAQGLTAAVRAGT